jgi:hypothetical protein
MSQRPPAFRTMTEWKWEDAASRSAHSSATRGREKIASASAEYRKADALHSRISTETLGMPGENRAQTLASNSHHDRAASAALQGEWKLQDGMPDSECCAGVVREKPFSFAPDSPRFLPLCECASVRPEFLCIAPAPGFEVAAVSATSAAVIAPARWVTGAAGNCPEPSFEMPCSERRGLVERRGGLFLHFCVECGRWGTYGYGATGERAGRWYCHLHRPHE